MPARSRLIQAVSPFLSFRILVLLLTSMLVSAQASADCSLVSGSAVGVATVALPTRLTVPRNGSVGTVLYDSGWVIAGPASVSCVGGGYFQFGRGYATPMQLVPGYANIYQTGVQGIGVKSGWANWVSPPPSSIDDVVMSSPPVSDTIWPNALPYGPMGLFRVQLIVTGPVMPGTLALPSPLVQANYGSVVVNRLALAGSTQIVSPACSVQNPSVVARLPTVGASSFPTVGSTAGQTAFDISLNCSGPTVVGMTFTDPAQPGNTSSTLTLGTDSSASGVAFQILYNGAPVGFGADSAAAGNQNQLIVGSSNGAGTMQVPLSVRYIRTGTVGPGVANGYATFTMSYQ